MIGKYEVVVQNARVQFKFSVERSVTILKGDSATGKTTLIDMIAAFQSNGENSGVSIKCKKKCVVLTSTNWEMNLNLIHDSIVFIDEGDAFVKSQQFASVVQKTDNYYVIATRASLFNLPYSVKEVYGIRNKSGNRYQGTKRLYSEFYSLHSDNLQRIENPDLVVVEDSNSGFEFFKNFFEQYKIPCISADGKSGIFHILEQQSLKTVLVIADGAAFGPELDRILMLRKRQQVIIYLPESFEWMILKSGLIESVGNILEAPFDFAESSQYFSWEQFFTSLLVERTQGSHLHYNKRSLNPVYLHPKQESAIVKVMPEIEIKPR